MREGPEKEEVRLSGAITVKVCHGNCIRTNALQKRSRDALKARSRAGRPKAPDAYVKLGRVAREGAPFVYYRLGFAPSVAEVLFL